MIRKKIAGSVECGVVTDRRRLRILDFLVKQGIPRQIKEKQNNDKSAFCLPRQDCGNAVKSVLYGAKWGRFLHL